MSIDISQFQEIFIEESYESLDVMEAGLLTLDVGEPDSEVINNIFRAAHSIKGGAGTFGFEEIAAFTHVQESLLEAVRSKSRGVSAELIDTLLQCVDCVRSMLEANRTDAEIDADRVLALTSQLERYQSQDSESNEVVPEATADERQEQPLDDQTGGWKVVFKPYPDILATGNDPYRVIRELKRLGECQVEVSTENLPDLEELDPEKLYLSWTVELDGSCEESEIREIFEWLEDDCDLEIQRLVDPVEGEQVSDDFSVPAKVPVVEVGKKPVDNVFQRDVEDIGIASVESSSIRVDTEKIEHLINLVGELVITQSAISQYSANLTEHVHLQAGLQQLASNVHELQEQSMRIRMLPIDFVFQRLPRLIRDLSNTLKKEVQFVLKGKETEVDKTVLEKISDPLVHIVRNALDHGIESPQERIEQGKSEKAALEISAKHEGGNIVISISDDGRGLDLPSILTKAQERGIVEEGDVLTDSQIEELIFYPGFSTAREVSDVSGRGVGLDVVKQNIKSLGGDVSVTSSLGEGTEFRIKLPLTMAILDGQLVQVGGEVFVLPMMNIEKSVQVRDSDVNVLPNGQMVYRFDDEYVPILDLDQFFSDSLSPARRPEGILVLIDTGKLAAILVDDVLSQQQVVIRSLEANFRRIETLAGATILGDGAVALILDANELVQVAHNLQGINNEPLRKVS